MHLATGNDIDFTREALIGAFTMPFEVADLSGGCSWARSRRFAQRVREEDRLDQAFEERMASSHLLCVFEAPNGTRAQLSRWPRGRHGMDL